MGISAPRRRRHRSATGNRAAARRPALLAVIARARRLVDWGDARAAAALLARAVHRFPDDSGLAARHAYALDLSGRSVAAAVEYRRALALDDGRFDAWFGLGCSLVTNAAYAAAVHAFDRVLALRPEHPQASLERGKALFQTGRVDEAIESYRTAAKDASFRVAALGRIASIVPGAPRADNAAILAARREWVSLIAPAITVDLRPPATPAVRAVAADGRLRIAYVSAYFWAQNWMKPVWGVVNAHDRSRFAIHLLYDDGAPTQESGYRPDPGDRQHDITGLSDAAVAMLIAELGVDILVDLNGYARPARLAVFMRRPAPLVVGWFNMYATAGIAAFDIIVGDRVVIPSQEEPFYAERVVRVPGSYLAFSVLYPTPAVAPPPSLANGHVTFGAFCPLYKITDPMVAAWSEILRQAPTARLTIKSRALGEKSNRADLRGRFARYGAAPHQITLSGPAPHYDFLAAYASIDIALDSFPYNGGTTTSEALWQGVPVLTFAGERWASRTSQSLLQAAGLGEWCEPDLASYVGRAVRLAGSPATPAALAALRATMRDRLMASPVCDSTGLCRSLERLYARAARQRGPAAVTAGDADAGDPGRFPGAT